MNLIQIPTDKLTGLALAWAVTMAHGHAPNLRTFRRVTYKSDHGSWIYCDGQFTDREAAEIVVRDWISVERPSKGQKVPMWRAITDTKTSVARRSSKPAPPGMTPVEHAVVSAWGDTYALAVMRAFVMSRLGDVVSVPAELAAALVPVGGFNDEAPPVVGPADELEHLDHMRKDAELGRWLRLRALRGWERFDIPSLPFVPKVAQLAQTLDEAVAAALLAR